MHPWLPLLDKLHRFKDVFGHTRVPYPWRQDPILSQWVENLRSYPAELSLELIIALQEIEFDFNYKTTDWNVYYEQLKDRYQTHTPASSITAIREEEPLGQWIEGLRQTRHLLSEDRIRLLHQIGFEWVPKSSHDLQWERSYGQLVAFKKEHGHCRVASSYKDNPSLAKWVSRQREKEDTMQKERKTLLDQIGFTWKKDLAALDEQAWLSHFNQLSAFAQANGHFKVPSITKQYHSLRIWVDHQRSAQAILSPQRRQLLASISFPWHDQLKGEKKAQWQAMYEQLQAFYQRFSHSRVPGRWAKNKKLGSWVLRQRRHKDLLSRDQIKLLEDLDFAWTHDIKKGKDRQWKQQYKQLEAFYLHHSHSRVADQDEQYPALGKWVSWQRKQHKEGRLASSRKRMLDGLQFSWSEDIAKESRLAWERMYARLKRFYRKYNHCKVPEDWKADPKLAAWTAIQRQQEKELSAYKKERLQELGFAFRADLAWERRQVWEQMYEKLQAYHKQHGHCRVKISDGDTKLFGWVSKQRRTKAKLPAYRLEKLNALGFTWIEDTLKAREEKWEAFFEQLLAFKERFGHCRVPEDWKENKKLATFVAHQRRKKDSLPVHRKEKLTQIGFFDAEQADK